MSENFKIIAAVLFLELFKKNLAGGLNEPPGQVG